MGKWDNCRLKTPGDEIRWQYRWDISLKKRSEWHDYLRDETTRHQGFTQQIITLETRMNDMGFDAFKLMPEEHQWIEVTTKYSSEECKRREA